MLKLNSNCVRDLLFYLEENLSYQNPHICINTMQLNNYTSDDLLYTAEKLIEADYIEGHSVCDGTPPVLVITAISFDGHKFLDTVRDSAIWKETKSKASKFASVSIPILQDLAVATAKKLIGLP